MPALALHSPSIRGATTIGWLVFAISVVCAFVGGLMGGLIRFVIWVVSTAGLVFGIRGARTRFVIADWGVTYRSMFRSVDLPWEEIESVEKIVGFTHHKAEPRRALGACGEKVMLVAVNGESYVCHDVVQDNGLTDGPIDLAVAEAKRRHRRFERAERTVPADAVVFTGPEAILKALTVGAVALAAVGAGVAIGRSWWGVVPGLVFLASVVLIVRASLSRIELSSWGVRSRWMTGSAEVPWSRIQGVGKVEASILGVRMEKLRLKTVNGDVVLHALVQPPNPLRGRVDIAVAETNRWMGATGTRGVKSGSSYMDPDQ